MKVKDVIANLKYSDPEMEVRVSNFSGEFSAFNGAPIYDSHEVSDVAEMSSGIVNIYGYDPSAEELEKLKNYE